MIDTLSEREKDVLERLVRGASLGKCFDEREFGFTWHGIRAILADCDDKQIRKTFYDVRQIELARIIHVEKKGFMRVTP